MRKLTLLLFYTILASMNVLFAQRSQVSGLVTDAADGKPIYGVSVVVKGATTSASTDNDGHYSINVPDGATLTFSFIGMEAQEIAVGNRSILDVILSSDATVLDDVVVVAYGTAKKGGFTGAAVSLDAKTIETRPVTSATSVLEGSTGIMMSSASGQPGSSPTIRIRGVGSINASSAPLVVVDGFPYDGSVADINPQDIENMTVLKDASSAALYGSRAANGVIMITTKKGRKGSLNVNFRTTHGFSERGISEYDRVDAYDYVPIMYDAMRNSLISSGKTPANAASEARSGIMKTLGLNPFNVPNGDVISENGTMNPNARLLYDDFDWDDAMTRTGYRGEYALSANGGTDKINYMFSLGYLKENGYIIASELERMNAKASVDVTPTKWFKAGVNITGIVSESHNANAESTASSSYANPINFIRNVAPIYPIYKHNTDGSYLLDENGEKVYEWDDRAYSKGRHIVAETKWNDRKYEGNTLGTRAYTEFTFVEGLKLNLNAGFDKRNTYFTRYENNKVGDGSPAGRGTKNYYSTQTWNFNQLLTYDKSFELHNIQLLAGHESYEYQYDYFYALKNGVIIDWNPELVNFSITSTLTSYAHKRTSEGYLFRANYDYNNKYYFSASFRRDGSSRFHKDVRWGNFWSVGASWRLDRENFMKSADWIDMLKLRAAYGQTGNDGVLDNTGLYDSYYPWQNLYDIQRNANTPGVIQSVEIGNSMIEWEKSSSLDVAAEFSFFNHRLHGSVEFYHRISDNLLFNVQMPMSSGVKIQPQNIGTMYNQGFEIDLTGDILRKKDFTWNMNVNISTIKNKITTMPDSQKEMVDGTKKLAEGHSRYDYWLRTFVGVNPDNGSVMYLLDNDPNKMQTYKSSDYYEHNGKLVTENQNYAKYEWHDRAIPNLYGAIRNTFNYKDLSLSVLFTYSIGGKVYDGNYKSLMSAGMYGDAVHEDILKRWQKPGDVTNVPRMDASKTTAFDAQSSRWLVDGSYISLKNITLSYNLPKTFAQKLDLSNIQAYVSAENIHLFSKRKGMNPSQNFTGVQSNVYLPSRIVTFGLSLSF